jgi:hypothetical protein
VIFMKIARGTQFLSGENTIALTQVPQKYDILTVKNSLIKSVCCVMECDVRNVVCATCLLMLLLLFLWLLSSQYLLISIFD